MEPRTEIKKESGEGGDKATEVVEAEPKTGDFNEERVLMAEHLQRSQPRQSSGWALARVARVP
jgi:hypothetical protein